MVNRRGTALASDVAVVDQRHRWPRWRRWLRVPDDAAIARRVAWETLRRHVALNPASPAIDLPGSAAGIFNASRAQLDHLDLSKHQTRSDQSRVAGPRRYWPASTDAATTCAVVDRFTCDITEVNGIAASKSSGNAFADVHSFGKYFVEQRSIPKDSAGLQATLQHNEIRVLHAPGIDSLSLYLWDDRLFLENLGGSHHFAAAAYLARELKVDVPINAPLSLFALNEPVWSALLAEYRMLLAPRSGFTPGPWVAELCGQCHEVKLAGRLAEGNIIFLPRDAQATELIVQLMLLIHQHN